jgi:hypothetical protein
MNLDLTSFQASSIVFPSITDVVNKKNAVYGAEKSTWSTKILLAIFVTGVSGFAASS